MSDWESDLLEDKVKTRAFDPLLLSRLLNFAKPYWPLAIFAFFLTMASVMFALLAPMLVAAVIDVLFKGLESGGAIDVLRFTGAGPALDWIIETSRDDRFYALWIFGCAFGVAKLFQFGLDWINGYQLARLSQNVLYDIRMQVFTHIQTRSLAYFHRNPVGRLITRVTNDVGALDDFFSQALLAVLKDIVTISGIVVLLLLAHWQLALVTMTVLPLMVVISAIFRRYARRAYRKWRAALSYLNAIMAETVNGVRVIQLFHREQKNQEKYEDANEDYRKHFITMRMAWAVYRPGYTVLQAAAMGLVIWFGGGWLLGNMAGIGFEELNITPGLLVLFIFLAEMFFQPIRDLVEKFDVIQSAVTSAERIFTVLDEQNALPLKDKPVEVERIRGKIEFKQVHFEYIEHEPVLRGISFDVEPGEMVAIVGHTGAGKTTIINLLSRFYDIQQGQILVDGVDVRDYSLPSLRRNIAVVHQDVFLFAGSIGDNLSLNNPNITPDQVRRAAKAVNAEPFILRFNEGYDHMVEEQGRTFSAGERQLLSFARALAHDPSILVLDEATSAIDTKSELLIQDAMKVLMKGRTSIVIAHRLSTIKNADKIVVLHHGEVAEMGNHKELIAHRGLYHKLYELQFAAQG